MGRGSSTRNGDGNGWKKMLRIAAKNNKMPAVIVGNPAQQSAVLKYIDKLYPMPKTNAKIVDQGDAVWVQMNNKTYRTTYPSGMSADKEEKRGALKKLLYNILQRKKRQK